MGLEDQLNHTQRALKTDISSIREPAKEDVLNTLTVCKPALELNARTGSPTAEPTKPGLLYGTNPDPKQTKAMESATQAAADTLGVSRYDSGTLAGAALNPDNGSIRQNCAKIDLALNPPKTQNAQDLGVDPKECVTPGYLGPTQRNCK